MRVKLILKHPSSMWASRLVPHHSPSSTYPQPDQPHNSVMMTRHTAFHMQRVTCHSAIGFQPCGTATAALGQHICVPAQAYVGDHAVAPCCTSTTLRSDIDGTRAYTQTDISYKSSHSRPQQHVDCCPASSSEPCASRNHAAAPCCKSTIRLVTRLTSA